MALLESIASGTPAVAAPSEVLEEIAGKLLTGGDEEAQAAALARLEADEELRTRLMRGGLARSQLFRWPDMARRTLDVYARVHTAAQP
jgi:glycosyltransferase involved in cell wall biosynthesis